MTLSDPICGCTAPIELAGATLGRYRHVCAFFRNPQEEYRVMFPFIKEGLARGQRTLQIVEPALRDEYRQQLRAGGVDVDAEERRGMLDVQSVRDLYLRDGRFDVERMLATIRQHLAPGPEGTISRITGHVEWAAEDWPGVQHFLEYEARLNEVVPEGRDTVVCLFDLSKTSAALIVDVLRTHPVAILGGLLQENPFYVPVEQFLAQLREREAEAQAEAGARAVGR
jgi:hypothetical protein